MQALQSIIRYQWVLIHHVVAFGYIGGAAAPVNMYTPAVDAQPAGAGPSLTSSQRAHAKKGGSSGPRE